MNLPNHKTLYIKNLVHEVDVIANSCGVLEPRGLRRYHVRIMQSDGKSIPLDELHPWPEGKAPKVADYSRLTKGARLN